MNPMKSKPTPTNPPAPVNNNPLTLQDKERIIKAITCDGRVKGLLEDVCQGNPNREAVEHFLMDCEKVLIDRVFACIPAFFLTKTN